MALSPRSATPVLILTLAAALLPASEGGQKPLGAFPPGEAIEAGIFQFKPAVEVLYGYDDNLLFRSDDLEEVTQGRRDECRANNEQPCGAIRSVFSDQYVEVVPSLAFRLPFSQSFLEVTYRPSLLKYREFSLDDGLSHGVDTVLDLRAPGGDQFRLTVVYDRGLLEVEKLEGAGESTFEAEHYRRVSGRMAYTTNPTSLRGFRATLGIADFSFDRSEQGLADYRNARVALSGFRRLGPRLTLEFLAEGATVERERVSSTSQVEGLDTYGAGVAARWLPREGSVVSSRVLLARLKSKFFSRSTDAAGTEPRTGADLFLPQAEVSWKHESGVRSSWEVMLRMRPVQSFFFNNDYYVSAMALAAYRLELPRGVAFSLTGSFVRNRYSDALDESANQPGSIYEGFDVVGARRVDQIVTGEVRLDFPLARRLRLGVGFAAGRRQSNIPLVDYDQARVFTRLSAGWL